MPGRWMFSGLICVSGGDIASDAGTFFQITPDHNCRRGGAGPVALLEAAIAAVEACDHLIVPVAGRRFGINQGLRLLAPFLAFIGSADTAQEMQRAEDFREPL